MSVRRLFSIAGSDPSGGAGIQGDLKTFSAFGCYGMAAVTALTAQNTRGVTASWPMAPELVAAQIESVMSDLAPDAIKIGMVATPEIARAIADALAPYAPDTVVLDPVLVPTQGASLASAGLEAALIATLLPMARIVTPNLYEAAALTGTTRAQTPDEMSAQGRLLREAGARAVLVKGGDREGEPVDVLVDESSAHVFRGRRIDTRHTHGTGCALSSAIACELAQGAQLVAAIAGAKTWLESALEAANELNTGEGRGAPNHFVGRWAV